MLSPSQNAPNPNFDSPMKLLLDAPKKRQRDDLDTGRKGSRATSKGPELRGYREGAESWRGGKRSVWSRVRPACVDVTPLAKVR